MSDRMSNSTVSIQPGAPEITLANAQMPNPISVIALSASEVRLSVHSLERAVEIIRDFWNTVAPPAGVFLAKSDKHLHDFSHLGVRLRTIIENGEGSSDDTTVVVISAYKKPSLNQKALGWLADKGLVTAS